MTRTLILNGGATISDDMRSAYLKIDDPLSFFSQRGINSGDILVYDSILRETVHDEIVNLQFDAAKDPKNWPEGKFDQVIIRGSNYLHAGVDLTGISGFLETLDCPIVAIGVGAQAAKEEPIEINAGSQRFWQVVSDRSSSLGVRGDFSAEVFESIGVKNVAVIGCPSLYRCMEPTLKIKPAGAFARFGINLNRSLGGNYCSNIVKSIRLQRRLIENAAQLTDSVFYSQGESEESRINYLHGTEKSDTITGVLKQFDLHRSPEAKALFGERLVSIFSVPEWEDHIRENVDFMVGFRLHGCAIALAQGIPSVLFTYDTRTREIASLFSIPSFEVNEFKPFELDNIAQNADFAPFEAAYKRNFVTYRDFLEANNVAHRLSADNAAKDQGDLLSGVNIVDGTLSPSDKNKWLQQEFTQLSKKHIGLKKQLWRKRKQDK